MIPIEVSRAWLRKLFNLKLSRSGVYIGPQNENAKDGESNNEGI